MHLVMHKKLRNFTINATILSSLTIHNYFDMEKRLTKSQLMTAMAEAWGVSKKEAEEQYMTLVNLMYKEINRAGEIMLPGLGKMAKKHRKARMGRNPMTGESIHIAAKTVLKFGVNKAAKDALL